MRAQARFDVACDRDEVARLAAAVDEFAEREEWPPALAFKANLAIEEFVLNVITHGSHRGLDAISVNIDSAPDAVSIEIIDNGTAFDPLNDAPEPDLDSDVSERAVGGLGIHMVLEMIDDVTYARTNGQNRLKMRLLKDA